MKNLKMKLMLAVAGVLLTCAAFAQTFFVNNLSIAGTVTMPSGNLSLSYLAPQAANSVVANATGSVASPTAASVPSCSISSSALWWVSGTGFSCNTAVNAAQLNGATFAAPGTIGGGTPGAATFTTLTATGQVSLAGAAGSEALRTTLTASAVNRVEVSGAASGGSPTISVKGTDTNVGLVFSSQGTSGFVFDTNGSVPQLIVAHTPSAVNYLQVTGAATGGNPTITTNSGNVAFGAAIAPNQTAGIVGTTTNNNANAGSVGEQQTVQTSLTAVTAGALTNYASKSLTAGDWRCQGVVDYVPAGTTTISQMLQGLTTTSAAAAPFGAGSYFEYAGPAGLEQVMITPTVRFSLASTTTVFLTGLVQFATSTLQARGNIDCWRVR